MKKITLILCFTALLGCSKSDNSPNCNFLFDAGVNLTVNTNLPQFSQLQFNSNAVYVANQGNNGIWLYRLTSTTLYAWDAADPSLPPSACSTLTFVSGDIVESNCDNVNQYSLSTGFGFEGNTLPCTLKPYRVDDLGNGQYLVSN